jgi:hypothetical protein
MYFLMYVSLYSIKGPPWPWSYGSWIYNYICNQCHHHWCCEFEFRIRARCTTLCDKVCQWLATGRWFSPGPMASFTNKTDRHDITEILLKVALNTIIQTNKYILYYIHNIYLFISKHFNFSPLCLGCWCKCKIH